MIKPTVGRKVWYRPSDADRVAGITVSPGQPVDATVVAVWSDHCVNLVIFDGNGKQHTRTSAYLKQDGVPLPTEGMAYAEWMPYQVGQAKKEAPASHPFDDSPRTVRTSGTVVLDSEAGRTGNWQD